jgi:hypothetical protein
MARFTVEQHGCDFPPACAFLFAIECADQQGQPRTLGRRQLQAAEWRASSFAGEATMQALETLQPRTEIVIKGNQESAAACLNVLDQPDPMAAFLILKQDMVSVRGSRVLDDRL